MATAFAASNAAIARNLWRPASGPASMATVVPQHAAAERTTTGNHAACHLSAQTIRCTDSNVAARPKQAIDTNNIEASQVPSTASRSLAASPRARANLVASTFVSGPTSIPAGCEASWLAK